MLKPALAATVAFAAGLLLPGFDGDARPLSPAEAWSIQGGGGGGEGGDPGGGDLPWATKQQCKRLDGCYPDPLGACDGTSLSTCEGGGAGSNGNKRSQLYPKPGGDASEWQSCHTEVPPLPDSAECLEGAKEICKRIYWCRWKSNAQNPHCYDEPFSALRAPISCEDKD